jgi:hypothetical protein
VPFVTIEGSAQAAAALAAGFGNVMPLAAGGTISFCPHFLKPAEPHRQLLAEREPIGLMGRRGNSYDNVKAAPVSSSWIVFLIGRSTLCPCFGNRYRVFQHLCRQTRGQSWREQIHILTHGYKSLIQSGDEQLDMRLPLAFDVHEKPHTSKRVSPAERYVHKLATTQLFYKSDRREEANAEIAH